MPYEEVENEEMTDVDLAFEEIGMKLESVEDGVHTYAGRDTHIEIDEEDKTVTVIDDTNDQEVTLSAGMVECAYLKLEELREGEKEYVEELEEDFDDLQEE